MVIKELITMKKVIIGIMYMLLVIILVVGYIYQKSPQEPPKLAITIGDKEVGYITSKNKWDGAIYDREDTFKAILKQGSGIEIPYIEIGRTAVIAFENYPPDKFTVSDILIDKNGNQMYSNREIVDIPVELKAGKCSFEIMKNWASGLSSTYVENKTDLRGFRMIASWGQNECEYAFIIKTEGL